jgi:hypothetical protein
MLGVSTPIRAAIRHALPRAWRASKPEPDEAEQPNTFAIPTGFTSATSSVSITVAVAGLMLCTTAAMGGYLAKSLFGPRADLLDSAMLLPAAPAADLSSAAQAETAPPAEIAASSADATAALPTDLPDASDPASPATPTRDGSPAAFSTLWPSLAAVPAPSAAPADEVPPAPAPDPGYAGVWAPHAMACSPQASRKGFLPAVIKPGGAWAGETSCSFTNVRRSGNSWTVAAMCADNRSSWKTSVKLTVTRDRLIWKSPRGEQVYVRCDGGSLQVARAAAGSDRLE